MGGAEAVADVGESGRQLLDYLAEGAVVPGGDCDLELGTGSGPGPLEGSAGAMGLRFDSNRLRQQCGDPNHNGAHQRRECSQ